MSTNLDDISILKINGVDHCCTISRININQAIKLLQNISLSLKSGALQNIKRYYTYKNE